MNKKLKEQFLTILLILCCSVAYSQTGEAVLILKDSTRISGIGEISGISSIVSVKFKNDTLKYRSYKPSELIGIDILENNYHRKFRYKYVNGGKFPEIMEIIAIDSLSLYVRVYDGSVLINTSLNEPIQIIGNEHLPSIRNQYAYVESTFPRYSYYVGWGESDQVEHLYSKGLPFSRGFEKSIKRYFKSCEALVEKVENKGFSNDALWEVVDFYNQNCLKTNNE